jgi:hypothetical protein
MSVARSVESAVVTRLAMVPRGSMPTPPAVRLLCAKKWRNSVGAQRRHDWEGRLTIAVLVLLRHAVSTLRGTTQMFRGALGSNRADGQRGLLTNREKASLNSETCSSVRESACGWPLALRSNG